MSCADVSALRSLCSCDKSPYTTSAHPLLRTRHTAQVIAVGLEHMGAGSQTAHAYDGTKSDVWALGVVLFFMLVHQVRTDRWTDAAAVCWHPALVSSHCCVLCCGSRPCVHPWPP